MKTLCTIIAACLLTLSAYSQAFLTNGLVAYYTFSGNANDASGYGNNLTVNGAVPASDRFGNPLGCYAFTNCTITGTVTNVPLGASDRTLTCWMKTADPDNNSTRGNIVTLGTDNSTERFGIVVHVGHPIFAGGGPDLAGTNFVADNHWHQIVVTLSSNLLSIYVDGNIDTSAPLGLNTVGKGIVLGADTFANAAFYQGLADDVRIYNRALSSSEVHGLYLFESSGPCFPHGATATATMAFGFIVSATITDSGCGYTNPPTVLIQGGGGTGAGAVATVSNGFVTGITITNAGIGYTSTPSIYIPFPITITQQPQSLAVSAYDTAVFSVSATGGGSPLTYQWSLDGTNLPGATANALTITNVSPSDLGDYSVSVSDVFGSVAGSNATLSMYPAIIIPFAGAITYWGTNVIFSVEAWGSGLLTYQWYQNGAPLLNATNNTLNFTNIQFSNAGVYTVVVSGTLGSVTNAPQQVVVNPAGVSIGLSPRITISGVVGVSYSIQRTTGLSGTNSWTTVTDLLLMQPVEIWVDTNVDTTSPNNPQNFYRVLPGQ